MGLFRKLFYRKPPDGLLEISQRLYVFDCCFMMDVLEGEEYKNYIGGIAGHLRDYLPNANFMVVNFREGEVQSQVAHILSEYDMTVMEYPRQYEGCPLLTMEMVHHFLRSSENWFSLGEQNVLLMHCERGGWPVLAFMLAGLLIYRKQYTGEQKTLDMIYKQAPSEVLQLMSPLNALPSQLRYLQYISRRNLGSQWPPLSRALALDCIIIRFMPDIDGDDGRRLIVRIYGPDPLNLADQSPKVLLSMPKKSKIVRHCKQADSELVKIDINCNIQGDIVFECISLDDDLEREHMMFRFMFNTSFIGSNILMLNRDEIDILWNAKDHFPKDFRTEVIFSEMDIATSLVAVDLPGFEEKEGLPVEAFSRVEELFSNADWLDQKTDAAANALQQITASNILQELETDLPQGSKKGSELFGSSLEKIKHEPKASCNIKNPASTDQGKRSISLSNLSLDAYVVGPKFVPKELQISLQRPAQCKIISPRVHGNFLSSQTSSQGSPMPMSRYQNASSPLGITALLEDHVSLNTKEAIHSGTLDASSVSSMASILNLSRPVHINAAMHPSTITPLPFSSQSSVDACTTAVTTALSSNIISSVWRPLEPIAPLVHPPLLSPLSTQYLNETQIQAALSPALSVCHPSLNTTHPSGIQNDKGRVSLFPSTPLPSLSHHKPSTSTTVSVPSIVPQPPLPIIKGATPSYSIGKSSSEPSSPPVYSSLQGPSPSLRDRKSTPSSPPPPPPSLLPPSTFASSITQTSLKSTIAPLTPVTASTATCPVSSVMPIEITPMSSVPSSPPLLLLPLISSGHGSILPTTSAPLTPGVTSSAICPVSPPMLMESTLISSAPSALHPPPPLSTSTSTSSSPGVGPPTISAPPPPPSPGVAPKSSSKSAAPVPPVPPPLASSAKGFPRVNSASRSDSGCKNGTVPPVLGPPSGAISSAKGQGLARPNFRSQVQSRRNNLKPYHWLKLTRAVHGSLWAETQKSDEASIAPEFDMQELESLFSAAVPSSEHGGKSRRRVAGLKPDKIQLVELRRANNCEIMLTKVKIPIPDLMSSVLALDDSMLDVDQVENLIKFCPTKEEIELLKFFLELMQVPRVESKLRVFAFKIQYSSQVSDLRANLNVVNSASEEIRNSAKLKRIMQTILSLGNALNHGTARGSAVGFRLDSLLKLTDTRARNKKMTLMHYLCKVLAEKLPELLDFPRDLVSLEVANKIQLKYLAEEMQAISKGLEKVVQELTASENDGPVSENFCKTLKEFLGYAEAEVGSLASLYSIVGRSADALALYFGEDPARCPFEQVVSTLSNFLRMFVRAHEENCKQLEFTKKKAQKNAENEKVKMSGLMDAEHLIRSPTQCSND